MAIREAQVGRRIRDLNAAGMTMLISMHELGLARDVADRVYCLARPECCSRGRRSRCSAIRFTRDPRIQRIIEARRL